MAEGDKIHPIDPLSEKWVWRIHQHDASDPTALSRLVGELMAEVRADERANAGRVCRAEADRCLAKGSQVGWKLNATGALAAMDRVLSGERVAPPKEGSD